MQHLILLIVADGDIVLSQFELARDGLFSSHYESKQSRLSATIWPCTAIKNQRCSKCFLLSRHRSSIKRQKLEEGLLCTYDSNTVSFLHFQLRILEQGAVLVAVSQAVDFQNPAPKPLCIGKREGASLGHVGLFY